MLLASRSVTRGPGKVLRTVSNCDTQEHVVADSAETPAGSVLALLGD